MSLHRIQPELRYFYPVPDTSGGGYCFRSIPLFVCFFVSLLARLRENGWTDLPEIFREGVFSLVQDEKRIINTSNVPGLWAGPFTVAMRA